MESSIDEKIWPINWHNNTAAKVVFVIEWLILIVGMIYLGGANGSGAGFFVVVPFGLFWLTHLIVSIFIKRDKVDKIFSLINIAAFLLPIFLAIVQNIFR